METGQRDIFQILTVLTIVLIAVMCMGMLLIFINPQIALNPAKPPSGARVAAVPTLAATSVSGFALPPTWTPTPTLTPTPTETPTPTPTSTSTPTITPTPTETPTVTPTVPSRTPTRRPPTRTFTPAIPTAAPAPAYPYRTQFQSCKHSGATFIEGTVYSSAGGGFESGVRVAMGSAPGGGDIYYVTSGASGKSPGYFIHVIRSPGSAPGNYFMWVADGAGKPLSDPNAGRVTTNALGPNDANVCWNAVVDFVKR